MTRTLNLLTLTAAVAAALALAACDKREDATVGQSVDRTIADARTGLDDAKRAGQDAAATMSSKATDAAITTKVNAALVADDKLKATRIDVDTKDGQVVLSGTAPDADSQARATTLAKAVEGVTAVDNRLSVKP